MATDLIQRAAAICGLDNPNSDQLAAWLADHHGGLDIEFYLVDGGRCWRAICYWFIVQQPTLLLCLAAAVVEVDRCNVRIMSK